MGRAGALLFGLAALGACRSLPSYIPPTDAEFEASAARYEARRLAQARLERLEALAGRGIEVQRADFIWDLLDYPAVELARGRDGAVSIRLSFYGHEQAGPVPAELWQALAVQIDRAFREPDPAAMRRADRRTIRRYGHCHAWHDLEASVGGAVRRITASPCMGRLQRDSLAYAETLARLAIDRLPICEPDRGTPDTAAALLECGRRFGAPTPEYLALMRGN